MGSKGRAGALQLPIDLPGSCERQRGALGAAIWVLRAYFPLNARSGTPNEILNPELAKNSKARKLRRRASSQKVGTKVDREAFASETLQQTVLQAVKNSAASAGVALPD